MPMVDVIVAICWRAKGMSQFGAAYGRDSLKIDLSKRTQGCDR